MRILIIGGGGMLGHRLWRDWAGRHHLSVTVRKPAAHYHAFGLPTSPRVFEGVDVTNDQRLEAVFVDAQPEVVVNCVGVIKQLAAAADPIASIGINSLLPHRLHERCRRHGARLIHVSTDCVFSGERGNYSEADFPDARDLYGRSKLLGEVDGVNAITVRTSIIGRELEGCSGLVEWFLAQRGRRIRGYRQAIYSGLTTQELARVLEEQVLPRPELSGVWQVGGGAISKYDLLRLCAPVLSWLGEIEAYDDFKCDRSLDSTRFRRETGYQPPCWSDLVKELGDDQQFYLR